MNMDYKNKLLKIVLFFSLFLISFGKSHKDIFITIGTGPIDGVFYPAGTAISEIIKKIGYNSSACSTAGSGENIDLLISHKIEMAIAMSDTVYQAYYGVGAYKGKGPIKNLTCITGLHPNYTQIVTLRDSNIKEFKDLKGKRVGIGAYNSGVELNARLLYKAHNMKYSDSEIIFGTPGELIEQLKNDILDAIFLTNTVPTDIIYNLSKEVSISFVAIGDEGIEKLREKWPFFFKETITKEDYNIDEEVQTVAVQNLLLVDRNLSEGIVYDITKAFFENLEEVKCSNLAIRRNVSLENYDKNVDIPFHKGALKYYKDKGLRE